MRCIKRSDYNTIIQSNLALVLLRPWDFNWISMINRDHTDKVSWVNWPLSGIEGKINHMNWIIEHSLVFWVQIVRQFLSGVTRCLFSFIKFKLSIDWSHALFEWAQNSIRSRITLTRVPWNDYQRFSKGWVEAGGLFDRLSIVGFSFKFLLQQHHLLVDTFKNLIHVLFFGDCSTFSAELST